MAEIKEIAVSEERAAICSGILRKLPEWFGVEAAICDYTDKVRELPLFAAYDGKNPVGFLAVKVHNAFTAEICVMGVSREYHRMGIGAALVERAEEFCRGRGLLYLTVKTLADTVDYEPYARTRSFYGKMGFLPLEVFPLYWDEENPCLFLVKHLYSGGR